MCKSFNLFLLTFAHSLMAISECQGVLNVPLRDNIVAIPFAPFDVNGNLSIPLIPKMAQYYKYNNIQAIYVGEYYTGGPSIPLSERKRLVKAWEEQANCLGFDLIVEVGALPFVETLELARYCSTLNVTAITAYAEIVYQATTVSEALVDLQRICDVTGSKLPLLYHELTLVNPLSTDEIFLGAKDGCVSCFVGVITSVDTFLDCKAAVPSIEGYQFYSFRVGSIAASIKIGMNASVSIDLFPDLAWKIKDAVDNCKLGLAAELQQEMNRRMYAVTNLKGGKLDPSSRTYLEQSRAAFQLLTCMDVGYRYPLERPDPKTFDQIRSNLQCLNISLCDSDNKY